jgi:hypothetical protein
VGRRDGSIYGILARERGKGKKSYRGEDATEDEAETVDVSFVVRVMLHGGWRGRVGGVVRLRGAMGVRGRMGGLSWRIGSMGGSGIENRMLTIILKGWSTLLGRGMVEERRG